MTTKRWMTLLVAMCTVCWTVGCETMEPGGGNGGGNDSSNNGGDGADSDNSDQGGDNGDTGTVTTRGMEVVIRKKMIRTITPVIRRIRVTKAGTRATTQVIIPVTILMTIPARTT